MTPEDAAMLTRLQLEHEQESMVQWLLTEYRSQNGARFKSEKAARKAIRAYIETMVFVALETGQPHVIWE